VGVAKLRPFKPIKPRLQAGDAVIGAWCVLPSAAVINVIAAAGMDFVIIDLEHGPMGFEIAEDMARAAVSEGCSPLARLGQKDETAILKALDLGAHGLLVAHVEQKQDAQDIVAFAKYYPWGLRGFSPYTRAGKYGAGQIDQHCPRQNEETLVGVILEGKAGIENLEAVLETEHLDLVYIGAYDLSQALGIPGQVNHPEIKRQMEKCIRKIRDAGLAAGGHVAKSAEDLAWMTDMGMQFITVLPDVALLRQACEALVGDFQSLPAKRNNPR
jgi:4-hydroxy-2-oxoheptanedioate aldolase